MRPLVEAGGWVGRAGVRWTYSFVYPGDPHGPLCTAVLVKDGEVFGLQASTDVNGPALEQDAAEQLVARAHEVCPCSTATRGNLDVRVTTTGAQVA